MKTVVANYILWPGAHFINFKFVPTEHRILYNNCVSVRTHHTRACLCMVGACLGADWGLWGIGSLEHVPLSGGQWHAGTGRPLCHIPHQLE